MKCHSHSGFHTALIAIAMLPAAVCCGQQTGASPSGTDGRLERHFDELNSKLDALRNQLSESLTEMQALRTEVRTLREQLGQRTEAETATQDAESLRDGIAKLQESNEVLQSEIKVHDQIKVETASKFPLRLTGTLLLTSFLNSGTADNFNLPVVALPNPPNSPTGSLSASASQTILGLEATGPHLWGGRTSADLSVDFWGGGSASAYYTAAAGSLRMRTAHARLEWPRQSIGIALDRPLLSPVQPHSLLTVAEPAFAWSGNLWSWLPQVEYQRKIAPADRFNLQLGILDSAAPAIYTSSGQSLPNAAERSRQPGYEARVSTASSWRDRPLSLGASGYYSRKNYGGTGHVDAWAAAADWEVPLAPALATSGQFYRGRAIGGLGGGAFKDYVTSYGAPYGLNAAGGWAQLSLTATPTFQINAGYGMDDAYARDLNDADSIGSASAYANLARNQTLLANVIYRPRTYLLVSAEFRQINSRTINGQTSHDHVVGLVTGYTF